MEQPTRPPVFGDVTEQLSGSLLRYLGRYVGDKALAEDLLQETLIRVDRGLAGFEGRSELKTWVFSIATRVAADHFRQPGNRACIVDFAESPEPAASAPAADERLVIDEMSSCVREFIDSLPQDYRAALVLHDLEAMTAAETAEVCGCTLATAKIHIHRARERLADVLRQECEFYRDREDVFRCDRTSKKT